MPFSSITQREPRIDLVRCRKQPILLSICWQGFHCPQRTFLTKHVHLESKRFFFTFVKLERFWPELGRVFVQRQKAVIGLEQINIGHPSGSATFACPRHSTYDNMICSALFFPCFSCSSLLNTAPSIRDVCACHLYVGGLNYGPLKRVNADEYA